MMELTAGAAALSPRGSSETRSGAVARTGSPPWTQIVRGVESDRDGGGDQLSQPLIGDQKDPTAIMENPSEEGSNNSKKHAWNKKPAPNRSVESGGGSGGAGAGGLMGEELWPALSESTKVGSKISPSGSSKSLSDSTPTNITQGTGMASSPSASQPQSPSSSLLPAMQLQSPSQSTVTSPKPNTYANHNPNTNHGRTSRQKSMKRDGGGNAMANGGFSHQPSSGESSHNHNNRDNHGNRDGGQRRNSFRRGNGEPHSRGDGSYQNYGGRRGGDSDRGNHDWNHQGSFNGRDGSMRASPRNYVRAPPVTAPFVPPAPVAVQPFMNPMGMPDVPVVYFSPTVPFGPPLTAPMYFVAPDPQLKARIVNQIDYYFSNENLVKDTYLRQNMDENGWVSVVLIAGFKKVKQLTENIQLILEAVQSSSVVEAQADKIRRRGDWQRWIMPPSVKFQNSPALQSPTSPNIATLCADIGSVMLDDKATGITADASPISSGDLNPFPQPTKGTSSVGC